MKRLKIKQNHLNNLTKFVEFKGLPCEECLKMKIEGYQLL
jgi:hypothetical protein